MAEWIVYLIAAFAAVNIFWFVLMPVLRTGGSVLPAAELAEQARRDVFDQITLGNTRQAIALLRQAHPMSERRAAHTVATWAKDQAPRVMQTPSAVQTPSPERALPAADLEAEIDRLVNEGRKIEAIKLYRERTGSRLVEAKDAIEAWRPGIGLPVPLAAAAQPIDLPASVTAEIDRLIAADKKIAAIKLLRDRSGLGLREAKQAIDGWV